MQGIVPAIRVSAPGIVEVREIEAVDALVLDQPEPVSYTHLAGHEIDVVFETPAGLQAVEVKSGSTYAADWLDGLAKWRKFAGDTPTLKPVLIYGGEESHEREGCFLTGWRDVAG